MSNFTTRGKVLLGIGAILAIVAFVKFSIIGYYPDEALPYGIIAVVGLGLVWAGNRFGRTSSD
ncbi:MAG: hypothetical protein L0K86_01095 [Actinomycetia bacterium]|nr:hypothetical protein [Actinomycetes bacterium]